MTVDIQAVKDYLLKLQDRICVEHETLDGKAAFVGGLEVLVCGEEQTFVRIGPHDLGRRDAAIDECSCLAPPMLEVVWSEGVQNDRLNCSPAGKR